MSWRRLLHHTNDASLVLDRSHAYGERICADKPWGFWVSAEGVDDWRAWREGESWGIPDVEYVYEVILAPTANVLYVATEDELRTLHTRFPRDRMDDVMPYYRYYEKYPSWPAMMEQYDGIVIAPYQWGCRLDDEVNWYYGWDCASGCIWNLQAIANTRHAMTLAAPRSAGDQ